MAPKATFPVTKILVVDDQHAFFFECIGRLEDAMRQGQGAVIAPRLVDELLPYAAMHFGTEERLMLSYNYPLRDMHACEHRECQKRLHTLAQAWQSPADAIHLLEQFRAWIREHMLTWDACLGEYLNARGVH